MTGEPAGGEPVGTREGAVAVAGAADSDGGGPLVVVMGVSGCGKSTVGTLLAERLGAGFADGDALHPAANVEKMASGIPLTDADRAPWLVRVGRTLAAAGPGGLVVACSALKRSYREGILAEAPDAFFLHLEAPRGVLEARLARRRDHFMPASLLDSQLATLEPLAADERGLTLDAAAAMDDILLAALAALHR